MPENMNARNLILAILLTIIAIGQIVLAILLYEGEANSVARNAGWGILWLSALFGWLPIFTFKRWGGVARGRSYVHTTQLVDSGIYAIVRHPQYLAGILLGVALALIAWHWLVGVLGAALIIIYYANTFDEEERVIAKFGYEYSSYAKRVPRLNFILGIVRAIRRRTTG
ncbi:MAG: isoprenylcysteine carboxylmethyltransferase family protein [Dehalococcoidia bacterium]